MNRCYICRHPGATKTIRGRGVCNTCKTALPRVIQLETVEGLLVKTLSDIQAQSKDRFTIRSATQVLSKLSSSYFIDLATLSHVIRRFIEILDPAQAKNSSSLGHWIEVVKTPEGHSPKFACVMPHCEVCAIVGSASELLRQLTDPPSP